MDGSYLICMANPSSSLVEVVKQVAEQQHTQASEIEKNKTVLVRLQTQLRDLETQMNCVVAEGKAADSQIYHQDEAIATTKDRCKNLEAEIRALYTENIKLKFDTEAFQEEFKIMLQRNNAYYEKMAAHRDYFWEAESKLPFMIEITKKRAAVKEMIIVKQELMSALHNSEGNAAKTVQDEIAYLESEMNVLKQAIHEKGNILQNEKTLHGRLRKEIEVEHKRCEAILKRLHCQVNKLQSSKRQWKWTIQQLEEKAEELRRLLGINE
ncbi:coiled-coil domain-containing protein 122 isoform X2 [Hemicordylus capensis]|uniref:coiled-coil domain-containing protein 122 isoform X2 n=1 Tax=Hemicordylus capensis TaxID=884348 RepID=UPI0023040026|nr:coiled-coil domain-containing protein 122 isoform X2 [Hemicordylus capensis]XP_053166501.1 coiled-coil domain-containing protein 122 isoform X2 [Hemicordylus capensis]XP_053166502.1 coiled-coil domain-containing protein 122 isoform X2 [Hemicordylus capensis]